MTNQRPLQKDESLTMQTSQRSTNERRRGSLSMELVFVLPILGVLLLGIFEYSLLFFARGEVVDAGRAGCRIACLPGATAYDVEEHVLASLSPRLREYAEVGVDAGAYSGDPVMVAVRVPMRAAAPDLLWPIGFGLHGKHLVSETRMVKE